MCSQPKTLPMMTATVKAPFRSGAAGTRDLPLAPCVAALLALLAWCVPNHQLPWSSFHSDLVMAAAFAVGCLWSLWHLRGREVRLPLFVGFVALIPSIPLVQLLTGRLAFAGDFWIVLVYLWGFAIAIAMGYRLAMTLGAEAMFEVVAWTLLGAGILSVGLAIYQWQRLDFLGAFASPMPDIGRAIANLNQPNHLATLLVLAMCGCAWLHWRGRLGGFVSLGLVAYLGFGLAMTQSRVGLLSLGMGTAWLILRRRQVGDRLAPRRLACAFGVILACVLVWPSLAGLTGAPPGRGVEEMASPGLRLTHWRMMLDAIGREPWTGYGWNQVAQAQASVAPDHPFIGELIEHSHNVALDLLIWNGVPLGGALLIAFGAWFFAAARSSRDATSVIAFAAVTAIVLHGLFEFALEYAYFLLPAGLLMGLVSAAVVTMRTFRLPGPVLAAMTVFTTALAACVAADYLAIEGEWRRVRFEEARVGLDTPRPPPPRIVTLTQLDAFLVAARRPAASGMSAEDLEAMRRVTERYPYSYPVLRYAAALALNDRQAAAQTALKPICRTHPVGLCESARRHWQALGASEPRIAAVAWPSDSP